MPRTEVRSVPVTRAPPQTWGTELSSYTRPSVHDSILHASKHPEASYTSVVLLKRPQPSAHTQLYLEPAIVVYWTQLKQNHNLLGFMELCVHGSLFFHLEIQMEKDFPPKPIMSHHGYSSPSCRLLSTHRGFWHAVHLPNCDVILDARQYHLHATAQI